MYRIEFKKIHLEANDETIGEVYVQNLYEPAETGEVCGYKVKAVVNQTGTEFSQKEDAEYFADIFKRKYHAYPHLYKVTTEVYKCS